VTAYFFLMFPLQSVFLALPLCGPAKRTFEKLQQDLEPYAAVLRFQNPETPHLTLQFWKEVMEIKYKPILRSVEHIAAKTASFPLHVTGAETFDDRVLFLSIAFSDELARLKKSCPWVSDHPFAPHITLARIHHPQKFRVHRKKIMKLLKSVSFSVPVDRLRLYAEVDGKKQTAIGEWRFSSRPAMQAIK
jgi:2'-5' RNA ligase